jgi:hypothetical protein
MFRGGREVYEKASLDMMKVIAVHELIHACGLDNDDHAADDEAFFLLRRTKGKNDRAERK